MQCRNTGTAFTKKEAAKCGGRESTDRTESRYFNAVETLLKVAFTWLPSP
jgi:hypothetical protein